MNKTIIDWPTFWKCESENLKPALTADIFGHLVRLVWFLTLAGLGIDVVWFGFWHWLVWFLTLAGLFFCVTLSGFWRWLVWFREKASHSAERTDTRGKVAIRSLSERPGNDGNKKEEYWIGTTQNYLQFSQLLFLKYFALSATKNLDKPFFSISGTGEKYETVFGESVQISLLFPWLIGYPCWITAIRSSLHKTNLNVHLVASQGQIIQQIR